MSQHDYVIDNSTGQNVRSDINSVLQAIVTNNSGSSAPSTTYPFQLFANTTTSKLQIRNAANNAFVDLLGLDGSILLADGSAHTPSLAFSDDLDTGIFSQFPNTINFATAGVERLELGNTSTIFNEGGADVDFRIESDSNTHAFFINAQNSFVGINESSPDSILHLREPHDGGTTLRNIISISRRNGGSNDAVIQALHDGSDGVSALTLKFASSERIRIDSSGNVGIGTASPSTKLDINGGSLIVRNDTNGQAIHQFQNRDTTSGSSAMTNELHFNFARTGGSGMNLSGGRIVVGKEREWVGAASNQDSFMAIHTCLNETPTERIRVTSNGSLLIGVTQVGENFGSYFSSDNNQRRTLNIGSSSTATQNQILFRNPNDRVGSIQTSGTSTSYNTTFSDVASKKNFENWTENVLSLFKNINPQKFNFKVEDDSAAKSKGFIAQEMVDKFPEAYLKQEDEMYMFNPSGMVVYLMKAVQELESKLAALESA